MNNLSPANIFAEVAEAVPDECKENIIVIGSLAVGYHYLSEGREVRTKDTACVLSPRIFAIEAGRKIAQQLLDAEWKPRTEGHWGKPGDANTPDKKLPGIRFYPPHTENWFIELLTVPESEHDGEKWIRVELEKGHYGLPSFRFLSISTTDPILVKELGIRYARPEMMALANLLEHPEIKPDLMSSLFEDRAIKRSNKDLGRVLAITYLAEETEYIHWQRKWK